MYVCLSAGILHCEGFLYYTDGNSDKENIDPIIISDDDEESSMPAARGETGPSDVDIYEGRVLHLRYLYQMTMEQRTQLIIKEIIQGT